MPIDPSVYQYCEAQDIPISYLEGYEKQPKAKQFEWKVLFFTIFFSLLALPLLIIFACINTAIKLRKQIKPPENRKRYHLWQPRQVSNYLS